MADPFYEPLPAPGQTPWSLNGPIQEIRERIGDVDNFISSDGIEQAIAAAAGELNPEALSDSFVASKVNDDASATFGAIEGTMLGDAKFAPNAISVPASYSVPGQEGGSGNIYSSVYTSALGPRWQAGSLANPTPNARPIEWIHKFSSATRPGESGNEWDQALYAQITKVSGSAYGAAITGYVRHDGGSGQTIGVHGRSIGYKTDSEVWGGWSYAGAGDPATGIKSAIGHEINLNMKTADAGWLASTGSSRGLVVVAADNSLPNTMGIDIGTQGASPNGKFWTGIRLRADGFMPSGDNLSNAVNNGETMLLQGASTTATAYNGIRFRGGNFRVGLSFAETTISNNAAILLADNQRIVVGGPMNSAGPAASRYLAFNNTDAYANFNNLAIQVNGVKVIGPQRTGWTAATGTATKDTFATSSVTLPQLAERVKALIDDLLTHGLIGA